MSDVRLHIKHYSEVAQLPAEDADLVAAAFAATESAYAPYSGFRVGAAVRLASGRIESASNQESEVFPSGMCAERVLLYWCQAHFADDPVRVLAVASVPSERECMPCGACRQVMADTEKRQGSAMRVLMCSATTISEMESASSLLPCQFELSEK